MIGSPSKQIDKEIRIHILRAMEIALRFDNKTGKEEYMQFVRELSERSVFFKNRIDKYDYKIEDESHRRVDMLLTNK